MSTPIKDNLLNLIDNLPRIVEPEISETPYYQILYEYKPFHTQFVSFYRIEVVSNDKSNYITPEDWFNQIVIYQHASKHISSDKSFKSIILDSNRYTLSQTSIVDYIVSQDSISKESEANISDENVSNMESQCTSKHILSDDISNSVNFNLFNEILSVSLMKNDINLSSSSSIGLDDSYEIMVQ